MVRVYGITVRLMKSVCNIDRISDMEAMEKAGGTQRVDPIDRASALSKKPPTTALNAPLCGAVRDGCSGLKPGRNVSGPS
jgi:hypothetical protein